MKNLLPIFRLFWVACCAVALVMQTRLLLGLPLQPGWLDGFVFGGTVFGYHWTHPDKRYRLLAWGFGLLGGICFLIPLLDNPQEIRVHSISLAPVLFWLAYYGFQWPGKAGLRNILVAKPITVALTWAWVTVLLPTPYTQWSGLLYLLLGRAAFIFSLALAYDLSDEAYDQRHGLKTLTGRLGFEKSFVLINGSFALAALCVWANVVYDVYDIHLAAGLFISLLVCAVVLRFLLQKPSWESLQKPLIDALMVLQLLLVLLFSN